MHHSRAGHRIASTVDVTRRKIVSTGITGGLATYLVSLLVTFILGKPSVVLIAIPPLLLLVILFGYSAKHLGKWTTTQLDDQDNPSEFPHSNTNPEGTA